MADGSITLWRQPNGMWRWRWEPVIEGSGTVLVSHRPYDTRDEAEQTAREAYPDARVLDLESDPDTPQRRRRWARRVGAVLLVLLGAVVLRRALTRRRSGPPADPGGR